LDLQALLKEEMFWKKTDMIKNLIKLTGDTTNIANITLTCLINLSSDTFFLDQLLDTNFMVTLIESLEDKENILTELNAILMCNLTRIERGVKKLLNLGNERNSPEGFFFYKLIDLFVFRERNKKDPFSWLGQVFMNTTQLPLGRELLLNPEKGILPLL